MAPSPGDLSDAAPGVVHLSGELDVASLPTIRKAVWEGATRGASVTLGMRAVTFLDCAALGALIWAHTYVEEAGGTLTIDDPSFAVLRVMKLTGVVGSFRFSYPPLHGSHPGRAVNGFAASAWASEGR